VDDAITSGDLRLGAHFADPAVAARAHGAVICHGFPRGARGAGTTAVTYPELADRIARETGMPAMAFNCRGSGTSDGDFSADGWVRDTRAAVDALMGRGSLAGVFLVGISEGGGFAIREAIGDDRVRGVVAMAMPPNLRYWARDVLEEARRVGIVSDPEVPGDLQAWSRGVNGFEVERDIARLAPRPLFLVHGAEDEIVPVELAREMATNPGVELLIVPAAGHRLRHDPRAVAAVLGWLERQEAEPIAAR